MVNLVPAKCPNCGAQLELDDNMKRAECSFCKSTIIVDDAIAKYKIEISGKVEVDGIKTFNQKIDDAKKYIKIEKYDEGIRILNDVLKDDPFNNDALCEWLLAEFKKNSLVLNKQTINEDIARIDAKEVWPVVEIIVEQYEKLKKLDEEKNYETNIKEIVEQLDYLDNQYNLLIDDEKQLANYFNEIGSLYSYDSDRYVRAINLLYKMLNLNTPMATSTDKPIINSMILHRNGKLEVKKNNNGKYVSSFKLPNNENKRFSRKETFDIMEQYMKYVRVGDFNSFSSNKHKEERKQFIGKITGIFKKEK